ncbi:MAG: alpha/beta hydrolase, partial [Flavihumibacter sp.]
MKLAQKLALNYLRAKLNMTAVFSRKRAAAQAFAIFCTPFRRSKKPEPPVFKKAERLQLQADGIRITGYRWNKGGGERIMIIHGFESAARNFDRYIAPLVKKGFEVISLDAPAHGASGGKRITLPLYVKSIEALVAVTGLP